MAPATFLNSGTIQPLCTTCSATKRWQPKRLVSSRSALTRPLPQANISKVSVKSSIPLGSLDSVFGRRRRSGLGPENRSPSRPVFTAAVDVEGSIAVDETSSAPVTVIESEEEKIAEFATDAAVPPPSKTERFKPRVPGQKIRREDPTVPGEALVEGAVFTGKVTTIQPFGAFVNFGAFTDGLVHISKMSTGYVSNVNDIVSLGQEVKVTILNVEQKSGRIALSMVDKEELEAKVVAGKTGEASEGGGRSRFQQGPDGRPVNRGRIAGGGRQSRRDEPQKPPTKLSKGQEVEGTVKNKIRSGVFVELPENEEGFLRYSDIPGGENMAPESSLQTGEKIKATVLKIDRGKVVLTMRPILDISSVNRNINKGSDSGATNPFEIAFRAFNLVPAEPTSPVEEDSAEESVPPEASVNVEEVIPEAAAVVEEVISGVTAGIEESASVEQEVISEAPTAEEEVASVAFPEVAAVAEDSPAAVDEGPAEEKLIPTLDEIPSESVPETKAALEEAPTVEEEVISVAISEVAAVAEDSPAAVEEAPTAEEEVPLVTVPEVAAVANDSLAAVDEAPAEEKLVPTLDEIPSKAPAEEELIPKLDEILFGSVPETKAAVEEVPIAEEEVCSVAIPEVAAVAEDSAGAGDEGPAEEELIPNLDEILFGSVPKTKAAVEEANTAEEEVGSVAIPEVAAVAEGSSGAGDEAPADEELIPKLDEILFESVPETKAAVEEAPTAEEEVGSVAIPEVVSVVEGTPAAGDEAPADEKLIPKLDEILFGSVPETKAAVEEPPTAEEEVGSVAIPEVAAVVEGTPAAGDEAPAEEKLIAETVLAVAEAAVAGEEVIPEAAASATVRESSAEKVTAGISPALVKQLRDETGAGMMDCKRALADTNVDIENARETLRKKGLASADKKASRVASEGLVGSYIHDSRIGVLVEVNCETDFVSRGPSFKSLVEDIGMQVVACPQVQFVSLADIPVEIASKEKEMEAQREDLMNKPKAIRARIVEGRVSKRLNEIALLEQPFIRDDSILVKDLVKQAIAYLGENIKVRRFERFVLGEGLQKKGTDFATEVAAQTGVKAPPVESRKTEEAPAPAPAPTPGPENKVVVSAALVKELRDQTGAGMMDCKKALTATENDVEKAVEFLRKKGLASAEKKASRLASEGLIGTYVHDGRIGILVEVNCETDFVARGERFKELVEDLAMQVAAYPQVQVVSVDDVPAEMVAKEKELESGKEDLASKPEAIRARIVDGRVAKRLSELALLDQPFIKDDKKLVKDILKETVAALGENIQVRRFTRVNLGENIEKKIVDFASEVAAQSGRRA